MVKLKQSRSFCKAILQKELQGNWLRSSTIVPRKLHRLYILMPPLLLFLLYIKSHFFSLPHSAPSCLLAIFILHIVRSNMCSMIKPSLISQWIISICIHVHSSSPKKHNEFHCHPLFLSISRHHNIFICVCVCMCLIPKNIWCIESILSQFIK